MIDIWQLHSGLGIAVEIPHLILRVLKDKAVLSVKLQRTHVVWEEKEKNQHSLCPLGSSPYLRGYRPCLYWGELIRDSYVCSKCHFHVVICFPDLQRRIHLLDSQPTQQPYKLCSCGIWSECRSFLFGNNSDGLQPCKAEALAGIKPASVTQAFLKLLDWDIY